MFIDPRSKLLQHVDRIAQIKAGEVPPPVNVEIDLSNRCSLGCEWCHFAYTHTRGPLKGKRQKPELAIAGGDLMPYEFARDLVRQLRDAGVRSITWTGGGEPTLHPQFDEIITCARMRGIPQGLYTHGGHINAARGALLKETMTFVYVSLDAADAASYKRDKGVDRYEEACDGIRHLVAAGGTATVGVGYLLTRRNWQRAYEMRDQARALGAAYCQFRPTILYTQDEPGVAAEDTSWMTEARVLLERLADDPFVLADVNRFAEYENWTRGYSTCWWSALQTVVTPNGSVWTCVNKREHPAALLGSCAEEPFADIWARRPIAEVDGSCRLMCRGHIANQALNEILTPAAHAEFV